MTPGRGTDRPICQCAVALSRNTWSTSVVPSIPSMNARTAATRSGSSVMTTASSARVELCEAFAEPMTARRSVAMTLACRFGDDRTRTPDSM